MFKLNNIYFKQFKILIINKNNKYTNSYFKKTQININYNIKYFLFLTTN